MELEKKHNPKDLNKIICAFDKELKKLPQKQIETNHYFSDGIYAREIIIPAGVVLVGKKHKEEHLNIISKGDIMILTEDGLKKVCGPCVIKSKPGIKRLGHALTETIWTTIHPNSKNIKDLQVLEEIYILKEEDIFKLENNEVNKCLG